MVGRDRWHWNLSINAWTFLMGSRYKEIVSGCIPCSYHDQYWALYASRESLKLWYPARQS